MSQSIARFRIVGICRGTGVPGVAALALALVAGCGGRPGDLRNLSATVSGLEGSGLVLQVNSTDVAVSEDGPVTLGSLPSGSNYQVSVKTQPSNPTQICTVGNEKGEVGAVDVTDVTVTCVTTWGVGGTVSGLLGTGLVLHSNLGDDLSVSADGFFVFPGRFRSGESYLVTVGQQPSSPLQTCSVEHAEGEIANGDVLDLKVVCSTKAFTVGGTVSGLEGGGLVLRDNASDDQQVSQDGAFKFGQAVADGASYEVTVAAQPTDPWQTCTVEGGEGVIAGVPVSSVQVSCVTNRYAVVGTVTGLIGKGLVLAINGQEMPIEPKTDGSVLTVVFTREAPSGFAFSVEVKAQPRNPSQTCTVTNGAGSVLGSDVTDIPIRCTTDSFAVGGTVSGLAGAGLVLRNGAELLAVAANGAFTFKNAVTDLGAYSVTVETNPTNPWQTCTVGPTGAGQVSGGPVTTVAVTCTTNQYALSATVSGLTGTGLVLQLNSGSDIPVSGDGTVALGSLPSGAQYSVMVKTQPKGPVQTCTVGATGSGQVSGGPVTTVAVACATNQYALSATVSGLAGAGLVLQLNSGSDIPVSGDGTVALGSLPSGAQYSVTVKTQPKNPWQTCTVDGTTGSGTVSGGPVTTVAVTCTTNQYALSATVSGLAGTGLVLQLNSGSDVPVSGDGTVPLGSLPSGAQYSVMVKTQPKNPTRACMVGNGSGTVQGADVSGVVVVCGRAWQKPEPLSTGAVTADSIPSIAMNAEGKAFAVWEQQNGSQFEVWGNRYLPGNGWEGPSLVGASKPVGFWGKTIPAIAMDSRGNAMVVWSQHNESLEVRTNFLGRRYAEGKGWEEPQPIEAGQAGYNCRVAMDSIGNAVATWDRSCDCDDGSGPTPGCYSCVYASRYVAGSGWGALAVVGRAEQGAWVSGLAMSANGDAIVGFNETYLTSSAEGDDVYYSDGFVRRYSGGTWQRVERVFDGFVDKTYWLATFASGPSGEAVVAWASLDGSVQARWYNSDGSYDDVQLNKSAGGLSSPGRVRVAMNSVGHAIVVWREEASAGNGAAEMKIWASRRGATGGWSDPELVVSAPDANVSQVALGSSENAVVVWTGSDGTRTRVSASQYVSGKGWEGQIINTEPGSEGDASFPSVVMDSQGNALAIWLRYDGASYGIWASRFQ